MLRDFLLIVESVTDTKFLESSVTELSQRRLVSCSPWFLSRADTNNIGNLVFVKYLNVLIYNLQVQCKQASIHQAHRQQI